LSHRARERRLRELVEQKADVKMIAAALGKTRDAVINKTNRLKLVVVDATKTKKTTTSSLRLPEELPSIEETLKLLARAFRFVTIFFPICLTYHLARATSQIKGLNGKGFIFSSKR
jgi:hypothetical protein